MRSSCWSKAKDSSMWRASAIEWFRSSAVHETRRRRPRQRRKYNCEAGAGSSGATLRSGRNGASTRFEGAALNHIMCLFDGPDPASRALQLAIVLAKSLDARITVLIVSEDIVGRHDVMEVWSEPEPKVILHHANASSRKRTTQARRSWKSVRGTQPSPPSTMPSATRSS